MLRPAVFLDRDGVLNVAMRQDWVKNPDEFHWLPGSIDAVRALNDAGLPVVLVTNQSGVGRGVMTAGHVDEIHARMQEDLRQARAHLDAIYVCHHAPGEDCPCRKPRPGLLLQAAEDMGLDLPRSVMIGDSERDLQAAQAAGCGCLVAVSSGLTPSEDIASWKTVPDRVFDHLKDAVEWILSHREGTCWK